MSAEVIYISETLRSMGPCYICGVHTAAPASFVENRIRDHKPWYCVNGHSQVYLGETEEQKLRRRLEWAESRAKTNREWAEREERRARAFRGQVTKIKNRVGNGVCPCCNRTFQNLMRHMQTKHPGYSADSGGPEE